MNYIRISLETFSVFLTIEVSMYARSLMRLIFVYAFWSGLDSDKDFSMVSFKHDFFLGN